MLTNMPDDADEETLKKYARAYILCLLGLTLMSDLYGDQVALHYLPVLADLDNVRRYSCGSAVLAFQYSQLCRASNFKKSQIGGCALLLQFWCWERMRIGRPQPYFRDAPELEDDIHPYFRLSWLYLHWAGPKHFEETPRDSLILYRDHLERMVHDDFIYRPYEKDLMERLHPPKLEQEDTQAYRPSAHELPSNAPPSQPSRPSTSQAPPSAPSHGHDLRPEKTPKQSWLQKIRQRRSRKD
ncbi:hypothetical protein QQ045_029570 [Rhodiola kirilowii]